ncbi:MAG: hypothetical protein Fur0044_36300 [Anaerolineae bacterium]
MAHPVGTVHRHDGRHFDYRVTVIDVAGHRVDLDEDLRHHAPALDQNPTSPVPSQPIPMRLLLAGGALRNDALLKADNGPSGPFHAIGDPTEGALVVAAQGCLILIAHSPRLCYNPPTFTRRQA